MQDPIYNRIVNMKRPSVFAASGLVLLSAIGLWASSLAASLLPADSDSALTAVNLIYYLPFVLLPIALYARRHPGLSGGMRLNPLPVFPTLLLAALALNSVYLASALAAVWEAGLNALGLHGPAVAALPDTKQEVAMSILTLAALPAVCEELLFRGFVLSAWESRGTAFAVGVSAGMFALLHSNLYGLPAYLLVGAVAGYVTWSLDSVYAGIVYHTIYNAACLVIPWLLSGESTAEVAVTGSMAFTLILDAAVLAAMSAMLLMSLRLRARSRGLVPIPRIRRPLERRDKVMLAAALLTMAASTVIVLAV